MRLQPGEYIVALVSGSPKRMGRTVGGHAEKETLDRAEGLLSGVGLPPSYTITMPS
jgi:hypothetical protein